MMIYLALAILTNLFLLLLAIEFTWGVRRLKPLRDATPVADADAPLVSIVVAARDEERNIEAGVRSLLAQDYPACELIVVNDRSSDRTGEILARIGREHPRLRVETIAELPPGWLGKNHALWRGAARASGELILFTDADVVLQPATLRHAVGFMRARRLDHLAASLEIVPRGLVYNITISAFLLFFSLFARPWRAVDPASRFFVGIGAFNLIRRDAYERIGTHAAIALRPDDDMKLGKLVKKNGLRQEMALGRDMISVEWYATFGGMVEGLKKNTYSGVDYNLAVIVFGVIANLLVFVWPFLAVWLLAGWPAWLNASAALIILLVQLDQLGRLGWPRWYAFAMPLGTLLMNFIMLNATAHNLWHGGISWRGTFYPLATLKKNRV